MVAISSWLVVGFDYSWLVTVVSSFSWTKGSFKNNFAELALRFAPDLAASD